MRHRSTLALAAVLAAGCRGFASSGCEGFDPQSEALALGESVAVEVDVTASQLGARIDTLDVNGGYYVHPERQVAVPDGGWAGEPSPSLVAAPGTRMTGVVTRTAAGVELQLGTQRFLLDGPLGCD